MLASPDHFAIRHRAALPKQYAFGCAMGLPADVLAVQYRPQAQRSNLVQVQRDAESSY